MKLHRLELHNFRGIAHRELVLPDSGVVVISGDNEIGKSSMIEALDLLLEAKDRSTRKEVKQVKPTHADLAAEITAEISTGCYRFVYRKRFHKKCETELTVLAPRREQLTGDEAHDRVLAILAETVDTDLWRAQRVLQASSTAPVDLSGCDALARALDVAAGEAVELSGVEPVLVDRVEAEYARYFTATGRPRGEWATARSALATAEAEVVRRAAAVAEVDDAVDRHAELSRRLTALSQPIACAQQVLLVARAAADTVGVLRHELDQAELRTEAAGARRAAASAAVAERSRLRGAVVNGEAAVAEYTAIVAAAEAAEVAAHEVDALARRSLEQAEGEQQGAAGRVDEARGVLGRVSDRDEANRLTGRLARIDAVERERIRLDTVIRAISVDEKMVRKVDTAATAVQRAADRASRTAARVELTVAAGLAAGLEVVVGGTSRTLAAGETIAAAAADPTEIEVPGLLAVHVVPGDDAADTHAVLAAARAHLDDVLAGAGCADVAAVHAECDRRRHLLSERDRAVAMLSGLCGDEPVQALRARLAALHGRMAATPVPDIDLATAQRALDLDIEASRRAAEECATHRRVAGGAAARLAGMTAETRAARDKLAAASDALATARADLAARRATAGDDEVAGEALRCDAAATDAAAHVTALGARLTAADPGGVADRLAAAGRDVDRLSAQSAELTGERRDVATRLCVYGTEGRKGALDAAEAELEHARDDHARVGRRARAAELLRAVVATHRTTARLRYVAPFRAEVQRLGRMVFGADFEVEIDSDLRICSRTLAGRTVPYHSLSGGAKEQLGIIARLAGAALVAKEDAVPVIIDDGLGFSDAGRLERMGTLFDAVGGDGQVVLLTCSPERYVGVKGAHRIHLTSEATPPATRSA